MGILGETRKNKVCFLRNKKPPHFCQNRLIARTHLWREMLQCGLPPLMPDHLQQVKPSAFLPIIPLFPAYNFLLEFLVAGEHIMYGICVFAVLKQRACFCDVVFFKGFCKGGYFFSSSVPILYGLKSMFVLFRRFSKIKNPSGSMSPKW